MGNAIFRTRRNHHGKFDSLTVCHDIKQAIYRLEDSFINSCKIVTFAQLQKIRNDLEKNGYKVFVSYGWEH